MDIETPMLSPCAGEAFFINQECFQERPSSGKVCQIEHCVSDGSTGLLPLITLKRQRHSVGKATRRWLMHMEPKSGLISLKCSVIDSPWSCTEPREPICPEIRSADRESDHLSVEALFKMT